MRKFLRIATLGRQKHPNGFSLVELMVVLVIAGILAFGVVMSFTNPTAKVKAAAFEMRGDFNLARAEAVRRNQNILVDFVFTACNKADVASLACAVVCSKVDKAGFDACYSGAGSNQGYVICFDEDGDNDCQNEVRYVPPATAAEQAEELEDKIIKTVLFRDALQYYEFGATLPSSSSGPTPGAAPDGVALASNNGITFAEPLIPGNDFIYMNSDGTSSDTGSVVVYLPKDGNPATLTVRGKPYAVVVDSVSTGRVRLERWRPDLDAWSRK